MPSTGTNTVYVVDEHENHCWSVGSLTYIVVIKLFHINSETSRKYHLNVHSLLKYLAKNAQLNHKLFYWKYDITKGWYTDLNQTKL